MPAHENQHFVPRAHLKPFSISGEGKAINLLNVTSGRAIPSAPTKGQCAKSYFYGRDLTIERFLQNIEGIYASHIAALMAGESALNENSLTYFRGFSFLQALRTEGAARRLSELDAGFSEVLNLDLRPQTQLEIVQESIRVFMRGYTVVDDLKVCVLSNRTPIPFITSDDPAIITNRYHLQRLRIESFGWQNSGLLLLMPLTPQHHLLCYDGLVYTVPEKIGDIVPVNKMADVVAMNELQALNCSRNLYFGQWETREEVSATFSRIASHRIDSRFRTELLKHVGSTPEGELYQAVDPEEARREGRYFFHTGSIFPKPRIWPTLLKFRQPVRTFSNGTAIGAVRKPEWLLPDRTSSLGWTALQEANHARG